MKQSEKDKRRGRRVGKRLRDSLIRLRHFRGHGVHSPYIYNIVREVFMRKTLIQQTNTKLYDTIKMVAERSVAIELQNIATLCGYHNFAIDSSEAEFIILKDYTNWEETLRIARNCGATVAILKSKGKQEFESIRDEVDQNHRSTLISKRAYLLIFNNHLPKQRFIL